MKWKEISDVHNGMEAVVSAKSTPRHPLRGEGPYRGQIECATPDAIPILHEHLGDMLHSFAWYWDVEIIQGIAWGDYDGDPADY